MAGRLIPLEEYGDPIVEKDKIDPFYEILYTMYEKVGMYWGISPNEFLNTSWSQIEWTSKKIDEKLAPYATEPGGEPGPMPINYMHLAILLALSSLFGGESAEVL